MNRQWCKRITGVCVAMCVMMFYVTSAQAAVAQGVQPYPTKPVRMVIAFPPGGSNDLIARFVGVRLTNKLGHQIVYDYRGGAAGVIGTEIVARALPDGYTLLFASTSHTMIEAIRRVPYDTLGSFTPVAMFGRGPNVLVANPSLPAKTFAGPTRRPRTSSSVPWRDGREDPTPHPRAPAVCRAAREYLFRPA